MTNFLAMYIGNKEIRPKVQSFLRSINETLAVEMTELISELSSHDGIETPEDLANSWDDYLGAIEYEGQNVSRLQIVNTAFEEYWAVVRSTREREKVPAKLKAMFELAKNEVLKERKVKTSLDLLDKAREALVNGNVSSAREIVRRADTDLRGEMTALPIASKIMADAVNAENASAKIGIEALDAAGLRYGNIITLGGDAGSKKTRASLYLTLMYLIHNPGKTAVYFEAEMPIEDIGTMLNQMVLRIDPSDTSVNPEAIEQSLESLEEQVKDAIKRLYLAPSHSFMTADEIYDYVTYYDAKWFVLDYLTMLGEEVQDNYTFVSSQMKTLKQLVHRAKCIGMILAQAKQNSVRSAGRINKIPDPSDLEWSSKLNQYSAYQYMTFYPAYYYSDEYAKDWFYLINKKNRYGKLVDVHFRSSSECKFFFEEVKDSHLYKQSTEWLDGYKSKSRMQHA